MIIFFSGLKPGAKDPKNQSNVEIYQLNPKPRLFDILAVSSKRKCCMPINFNLKISFNFKFQRF